MRILAVVSLAALAAPVWAQSDVDTDVIADLVGALAANGCQVTEDEADPLLDPLGHGQSDIRDAADWLVERGAAGFDGSTLVLTDAACAAVRAAPAPGDVDGQFAVLVQLFQDNDCALAGDATEEAFALLGLNDDDAAGLIARLPQMVVDGQLTFDPNSQIATLSGDLCAGGAVAVPPRDILLQAFADNGCAQPRPQVVMMARALGLDDSQIELTLEFMEDAGEILAGENVMLRSDLCIASPISLDDPVLARLATLADDDCKIITTGLLSRLEESGVPREDVMLHDLRLTGLLTRRAATQEGLAITLPPEMCGAGLPPATDAGRAAVIAALAAYSCRLTEAQGQDLLPDYGISFEDSEPVVIRMIAEGVAIFADGELILAPSVCAAGMAP